MVARRRLKFAGLVFALAVVPARTMPPELRGMEKLAPWRVIRPEPLGWEDPSRACGLTEALQREQVRLDYDVKPEVSDEAATREIAALDRKVVHFLRARGWIAMKRPYEPGIPDVSRCYRKGGAVVQVYQTTGRCTMDSPCEAYDGFAVVLYGKRRDGSARQRSGAE